MLTKTNKVSPIYVTGVECDVSETGYWIDDLQCLGTEDSLATCRKNPYGVHNCFDNECINIECEIEKLDIPNNTPGMMDGTNIVSIYNSEF